MALRGSAAQVNTSAAASVAVVVSGIGGTGPQLNDISVLCLSGGGGNGHAETVTFPTGYGAIPGISPYYCAFSGSTIAAAYKVCTGSEPSSYTIGYDISDFLTAQCWVFSGRNTISPFSAVATTAETTLPPSPATLVLSGLTATATDDVLEFVTFCFNPGTTPTLSLAAPSGYTNARTDYDSATGFSQMVAGCTLINSAGGASGTNGGVLTYTTSLSTFAAFQMSITQGSGPPLVKPWPLYRKPHPNTLLRM